MTASLGSGTTLDAIFVRAIQHHQNGQLREAESCYRAVLGMLPDHPDANHNMGIIALQCGQPAAALPFVRKAVKSNGAQWQYWVTYIEALAQLGDRGAAHAAFKQLRRSRFPRQQIDALLARLNAPSAAEVTEATRLFENNDATNGESFARDLVKRYPAHGFGWKALALFLHKRGQLDEAVTTMTEAAKLMPSDQEVHYNLGVFEQERMHDEVAVRHYRQAIDIQPHSLPANFNLAFVLLRAGRHVEAEACYRRVLALAPSHDGAYNNYAGLLRFQGRQVEAEAMYRRLLLLHPDRADAYSNLAVVFQETDRHEKARRYCRIALALSPDYVEALYNYGNSERELGFLPRAEQLYRRGLQISPQAADAANNLGFILLEQGHPEAAEEMFVRSMKMRMTEAEAKYYAASTLAELGFHALAEARYQQLLQEDSGNIDARASLALLRAGQGRQDEAEQDLSFSIERASQMIPAQSNLLFSLNYNVSRTAEEIFAVYKNFDEQMAAPLRATWSPHLNNRDHNRRLKVGYVSPDFRYHSTRMFLAPLLAHHDREAFEIHAFAEIAREDAMTERYRAMVDNWVPTRGIADADLAARIRELGIDILVDLAGHTAGNRLAVFARKPAPVSLTWMGYNYTTGLSAIDYFLTDATCAPNGSEHLFAEQPWRIEEVPFAFRPAEGMGDVSPLPATSNGYVTFGTLSRSVRINHRTVRVWAELLKRVPNSRLVVNSANFKSSFTRDALVAKFEAHGVSADRLEMGYDSPPWDLLRTIDITLDCFPHCSGTTLFESLYMGLPFVTLLDRPSVGRLGAAILKALGRPEWIAETEGDYVEIAAALARDLPGLEAMRATLRSAMQASRIMDEIGTTRRIEQAYRQMWLNWCETAQ